MTLRLVESLNLNVGVIERQGGEPLPVADMRTIEEYIFPLFGQLTEDLGITNHITPEKFLIANGEPFDSLEEIIGEVVIKSLLGCMQLRVGSRWESEPEIRPDHLYAVADDPVHDEICQVGENVEDRHREPGDTHHQKACCAEQRTQIIASIHDDLGITRRKIQKNWHITT